MSVFVNANDYDESDDSDGLWRYQSGSSYGSSNSDSENSDSEDSKEDVLENG